MAIDEDYGQSLLGLLPYGPAWPRDADSPHAKLLGGLAVEMGRLDASAHDLLDEFEPRTTLAFLQRWEAICGIVDLAATLTQRQLAVYETVTRRGGQTAAYYIAMAARLGFTATVTEFTEYSVDLDVDQPLYGADWAFAWQVNLPLQQSNGIDFSIDADVDTPLGTFVSVIDTSPFVEYKPAHSSVLFSYQ